MPEDCQGPCFARCATSPIVALLAYTTLACLGAAAYYAVSTAHMGTPFLDSLDDAQRLVLRRSKRARAEVFARGVALSALLLALMRPIRWPRVL
jgi:hypothetical protein